MGIRIITMTTTETNDPPSLALVRLLQLVSPALPVGAYAYSQGLEHAVHSAWVHDRDSALAWISGIMQHSICSLDLPVLQRLYRAWSSGQPAQVEHWSRFLCASRESAELLAEDRHIGMAMARLLSDLGNESAGHWVRHPDVTWATLFSLAAVQQGIRETDACVGYLWAWCENQVAVAIKLVPLGQTDGQRILQACAAQIPRWCQSSMGLDDRDIGQLAPALAIGSALHEQQYSRMFRS